MSLPGSLGHFIGLSGSLGSMGSLFLLSPSLPSFGGRREGVDDRLRAREHRRRCNTTSVSALAPSPWTIILECHLSLWSKYGWSVDQPERLWVAIVRLQPNIHSVNSDLAPLPG